MCHSAGFAVQFQGWASPESVDPRTGQLTPWGFPHAAGLRHSIRTIGIASLTDTSIRIERFRGSHGTDAGHELWISSFFAPFHWPFGVSNLCFHLGLCIVAPNKEGKGMSPLRRNSAPCADAHLQRAVGNTTNRIESPNGCADGCSRSAVDCHGESGSVSADADDGCDG